MITGGARVGDLIADIPKLQIHEGPHIHTYACLYLYKYAVAPSVAVTCNGPMKCEPLFQFCRKA